VISRKQEKFFPLVSGHNRTRITHVGNKTLPFDDQHYDGARARAIMCRLLFVRHQQELPLSFQAARCQRLGGVLRKRILLDDDLMKMVFQEVGTGGTTMAIVDGEVGALRPAGTGLVRRLGHIEDDRHPVLIVVSLDSLMGVCCI